MTTKEAALGFLYKQLKEARIAHGKAETRPGVTREELDNLQAKIDAIEWLLPFAIAADDRKISPQEWDDWGKGKGKEHHENRNFENQG